MEVHNKIMFLERGNERAGYKHILAEHGREFSNKMKKLSIAKLPDILFNALQHPYVGKNKTQIIL